MPIDWNANLDPAQERRIARKQQEARREVRYDLAHGTSISPKEADEFARFAPTHKPMEKVYWKEYGAELRRQRGRG